MGDTTIDHGMLMMRNPKSTFTFTNSNNHQLNLSSLVSSAMLRSDHEMQLRVRRESLQRDHQFNRMTSFRLPQETTRQLLRHPILEEEEEEDDDETSTTACSTICSSSISVSNSTTTESSASTSSTTSPFFLPITSVPQQPLQLNRRKRALARTPPTRMTSFRLPKDTTHRLLTDHPLEAFPEEDDYTKDYSDDDDHEEEEEVHSNNNSNMLNKRKRLLKNDRHSMTSFRLPKENTVKLLHWHLVEEEQEHEGDESDDDDDDDDNEKENEQDKSVTTNTNIILQGPQNHHHHKRSSSCSSTTSLPHELVRQSSFSARTA